MTGSFDARAGCGRSLIDFCSAPKDAAGLLTANRGANPTQATTLSPSGGLTILSNEIGQPEDCPSQSGRERTN